MVRNALRHAENTVELDCCVKGSSLQILVSDDGPGLSEESFRRMLLPFQYQNHGPAEHKSSGLGLAIAEAGVKLHKGELTWEHSRLGGLTVCVKIELDIERDLSA